MEQLFNKETSIQTKLNLLYKLWFFCLIKSRKYKSADFFHKFRIFFENKLGKLYLKNNICDVELFVVIQVILIDPFIGASLSTCGVSNEQFAIWTNHLVSEIEEVKTHFRRYGLLDDFISFCHGKISEIEFPDSVSKIALARLDVGSYESYSHALTKIYPLMNKGGCVILGDWHLESCRAAVYDFIRNNKLNVLISELFKGHLADAHFFI